MLHSGQTSSVSASNSYIPLVPVAGKCISARRDARRILALKSRARRRIMRTADGSRPLSMKLEVTGLGLPLVLVSGALAGWLTYEPHAEHWSRERRVIRAQLRNVDLGLRGDPCL